MGCKELKEKDNKECGLEGTNNSQININGINIKDQPYMDDRQISGGSCLFPIINGTKLTLSDIERELLAMSLFVEINKVRMYPTSYISEIEYFMSKIKENSKESFIKVSQFSAVVLKNGKESFNECIEFLKKQKPLKPLNFENALKIDFPKKLNTCAQIEYIGNVVKKKIENLNNRYAHNLTLKRFHFDINAPFSQASCALQIIDDTNSDLMRRKNIFNEDINVIHINCEIISRGIVCYYLAFGEKL